MCRDFSQAGPPFARQLDRANQQFFLLRSEKAMGNHLFRKLSAALAVAIRRGVGDAMLASTKSRKARTFAGGR
jgi:hypothetical protein